MEMQVSAFTPNLHRHFIALTDINAVIIHVVGRRELAFREQLDYSFAKYLFVDFNPFVPSVEDAFFSKFVE